MESRRAHARQSQRSPIPKSRQVSRQLQPRPRRPRLRAGRGRQRRVPHRSLGRALELCQDREPAMKIEAITLRQIEMPLVHFFETSFGRVYDRRMMLVTVHCEGLDGWGECVADEAPFYSSESVDTAWYAIREFLGPMLLGKTLEKGGDVPALLTRVRGHRMAKGALENAIWDAEAKAKNLPLWKLLGGTRTQIPCGVSIGIQDSHEQLLEKIETELGAGYQRIKLKVKPGWDLDVLTKVRQRWP